MGDLENRLRRDLKDIADGSDLIGEEPATLRAARRRRALVVAMGAGGAMLVAATSFAIFTEIGTPGEHPQPAHEQGEVRPEVTAQERAEVFVIRALVDADLFNPRGDYYSFSEDVVPVGDDMWRIGFGASRCGWFTNKNGDRVKTCRGLSGHDKLGNSKTDSWMTVTLAEDRWRVTRLEGNFTDEAAQMLEFTLPDRNEIPHWEYPAVAFNSRPGRTSFEAADLWVGPIPYSGPGSYCRTIGSDASGKVVYESKPMYFEAPDEHWERAGGLMGSGFDRSAADVTVECTPFAGRGWQPVNVEFEVIGDEAVQVIAPLRFYGSHVPSAAAECDAYVYDGADQLMGTGFQQIRGTYSGRGDERHYDLSFRIETDRPEDAVRAEVECRMA